MEYDTQTDIYTCKNAKKLTTMAFLSSLLGVIVAYQIKDEFVETLIGCILIGSLIGNLFGFLALIINMNKSTLVNIFSVIPMIPVLVYLILAIPYLMYNL